LDAAIKAEFKQQFQAVQVLYLAMLASLAGYLVIGLVLGSARASAAAAPPLLVQVLYSLSIALAGAAFFVKRRMVRPVSATAPQAEIRRSLGSFRPGHLIVYVLCEGIGLLGLLALFLGGSRSQFVNLIVAAFGLMLLLRPKRIDPLYS
jgi:hypothetical protein